MKNKFERFWSRVARCVVVVVFLALAATVPAATNTPPTTEFSQTKSAIYSDTQVYSIRYPGGYAFEFFNLMRSNGFANDTIVFAGGAADVRVPAFTVRNVQLKEVAKTLEFVTEGRLVVEMVMQGSGGDVNIWRIKQTDRAAANFKTKACAVPNLLAGKNPGERVNEIVERVERLLLETSYQLTNDDSRRPFGRITMIPSEKIVVAVGAEAYVEAVSSALEAAESVSSRDPLENKLKH